MLQTKPHQFSDIENLKESKNIKRKEEEKAFPLYIQRRKLASWEEQNYGNPTAEVAAW